MKTEKAAFYLFLASITLLPIGLGGNRSLPFGLAQAVFGLSFLLVAIGGFDHIKALFWPTRLRIALFLFACVLLWAFAQTLELLYNPFSHFIWQESASTLNRANVGSIAVDPESARAGLARLFTYISSGILAFLFCQQGSRAKTFLNAFYISAFCVCLYGFIMHLFGIEYVLWQKKENYIGDLTATFINRNHFALYANLALIAGAALLVQSWHDASRSRTRVMLPALFKKWFFWEGLFRLFSLLLILFCIISSHSRAGLFLAAIGISLFALFYQIYRRNTKKLFFIMLMSIAGLLLGAWFALQHLDRFVLLFVDSSSQSRLTVYALGWQAFTDQPWLGYGLNSFASLFRFYQKGMVLEFNHAHNDILESILDLGLPAAMLLWLAIALLISGLWHGLTTRKRNGIYAALGLSATFVVLLHAAVDFSLQIPALAILFTSIMGMGLAQSWRYKE